MLSNQNNSSNQSPESQSRLSANRQNSQFLDGERDSFKSASLSKLNEGFKDLEMKNSALTRIRTLDDPLHHESSIQFKMLEMERQTSNMVSGILVRVYSRPNENYSIKILERRHFPLEPAPPYGSCGYITINTNESHDAGNSVLQIQSAISELYRDGGYQNINLEDLANLVDCSFGFNEKKYSEDIFNFELFYEQMRLTIGNINKLMDTVSTLESNIKPGISVTQKYFKDLESVMPCLNIILPKSSNNRFINIDIVVDPFAHTPLYASEFQLRQILFEESVSLASNRCYRSNVEIAHPALPFIPKNSAFWVDFFLAIFNEVNQQSDRKLKNGPLLKLLEPLDIKPVSFASRIYEKLSKWKNENYD